MASDFSPRMRPVDLAQWLLRTYGEDYREDVAKFADSKINGELFLDLPKDEELLKELKLSLAFRRLVVKKAKEMNQSKESLDSDGQATNSTASTATVTNVAPQVPASKIDTDLLTPDHLQQVLDVTWEARMKYYQFGTALGLKADTLDAIEQSNHYKVDGAFTDVIKACLRQGLVTKKKLVEAVSSKQVAYSGLGEKIMATNFTAQEGAHSPPDSVLAAVPTTAPTVANFDNYEVKNHIVSRLEWVDPTTGRKRCTKVYQRAASKWNRVAECLGMEPGEISSIRQNNPFSDDDRVTRALGQWFENANNLPNFKRYPKKWSGLIRLLKDSELGELSDELEKALSAPCSSVRDTLPYYAD